jgi:hypothetical protein
LGHCIIAIIVVAVVYVIGIIRRWLMLTIAFSDTSNMFRSNMSPVPTAIEAFVTPLPD